MFKPHRAMKGFPIAFALVLVAGACGGSSADVEAPDAGGDTIAVEEVTTTEAVAADDHSEEMDEHMEGDDHEESEHMEGGEGDGHEEEGHGGGDGNIVDPEDAPEDARVVFVTMNEWGYDPQSFTAKAGETVVFRINNAGIFAHEFRLSNAHRIEEHIASGHEGHGDGDEAGEGGHHSEDGDIMIELEPGAVGELVVTFPTDTSVFTEVVCLIPDHYENGMFAELTYGA